MQFTMRMTYVARCTFVQHCFLFEYVSNMLCTHDAIESMSMESFGMIHSLFNTRFTSFIDSNIHKSSYSIYPMCVPAVRTAELSNMS